MIRRCTKMIGALFRYPFHHRVKWLAWVALSLLLMYSYTQVYLYNRAGVTTPKSSANMNKRDLLFVDIVDENVVLSTPSLLHRESSHRKLNPKADYLKPFLLTEPESKTRSISTLPTSYSDVAQDITRFGSSLRRTSKKFKPSSVVKHDIFTNRAVQKKILHEIKQFLMENRRYTTNYNFPIDFKEALYYANIKDILHWSDPSVKNNTNATSLSVYRLSTSDERNIPLLYNALYRTPPTNMSETIKVMIGQEGFNDLGFRNPAVKTPNIDAMANEGVILDNYYVAPICTPSRHTLMTGTYGWKHGMSHLVFADDQPACAPLDLDFFPQRLQTAGYTTHMVGKWHLGFCKKECTPNNRGFDSFVGLYSGMGDFYEHTTEGGYDWKKDYETDDSAKGVYTTTVIANRVQELLDGDMPSDKPFFWYISHTAPHTPLQVPDEYLALYDDATFSDDPKSDAARKVYLAMISAVDESIGQMVDALKENDLYDNTIFIFSSDNGGEHGDFHHSDNSPLRGGKAGLFEGGSRVNAFVHSALLPEARRGAVETSIIHAIDMTPTITHMANGNPDQDDYLDGMDMYDVIFNGDAGARTEFVYNLDMEFPQMFGQAAIRVNDFKLIWGHYGFADGYGNETQTYWNIDPATWPLSKRSSLQKRGSYEQPPEVMQKMMQVIGGNNFIPGDYDSGYTKLFNIAEDPFEENNLAESMPDKTLELKQRVMELVNTEYKSPGPEFSEHVEAALPENNNGNWETGWC